MEKNEIGIGLMGLGVIGGQVARVLLDKAEVLGQEANRPIVLRKVKVLEQDLSRPQAKEMESRLFTTDEDEFFATPGLDIIIEVIGGENPARRYLGRAGTAGKHGVTANKEVIAQYGTEV